MSSPRKNLHAVLWIKNKGFHFNKVYGIFKRKKWGK